MRRLSGHYPCPQWRPSPWSPPGCSSTLQAFFLACVDRLAGDPHHPNVRTRRWTLRFVAVVALVAAGVVLALHPVVNVPTRPDILIPPNESVRTIWRSVSCISPLERFVHPREPADVNLPAWSAGFWSPESFPACSAATNGRVRLVESLGAGGLVVLSLSFLPYRRRDRARTLHASAAAS